MSPRANIQNGAIKIINPLSKTHPLMFQTYKRFKSPRKFNGGLKIETMFLVFFLPYFGKLLYSSTKKIFWIDNEITVWLWKRNFHGDLQCKVFLDWYKNQAGLVSELGSSSDFR